MRTVESHVRPNISPGTHPIERMDFVVPTIPILDLLEDAKRWIDDSVPGAIIEGKQRLGKTRALRYLAKALAESVSPPLKVLRFNCKNYPRPARVDAFYGDLLFEFRQAFHSTGKYWDKRRRLVELLAELGHENGYDRVIVLIDDAQRLQTPHYEWLMDIGNDLEPHGVALTTLLFGQPALIDVRTSYWMDHQQIVGRFMVEDHHFRGLTTPEDFEFVLSAYDRAEHPPDSGCYYPQYYFAAAFAVGWRLRHEAPTLYRAFTETHEEKHLPGAFELPMQYFTRAVRYALRHFGGTDAPANLSLSLNQWKEAVQKSGYAKAAVYYQPPKLPEAEKKRIALRRRIAQ